MPGRCLEPILWAPSLLVLIVALDLIANGGRSKKFAASFTGSMSVLFDVLELLGNVSLKSPEGPTHHRFDFATLFLVKGITMRKQALLTLTVIVCTLIFATADVNAQTVPARLVGAGAFNSSDLSFSGSALGNHFGNCSFAGSAALFPLDETGLYQGYIAPDIYTAANGDTLELLGIGTLTLEPIGVTSGGEVIFTALWDGTWSVVPDGENTGRFANASGSYELTAENLPFTFSDPYWYFTYEKVGELNLGRRR